VAAAQFGIREHGEMPLLSGALLPCGPVVHDGTEKFSRSRYVSRNARWLAANPCLFGGSALLAEVPAAAAAASTLDS
jgi:hypothetical protein